MSQARTMSLEEEIRGLSPVAAHALACAEITDDIEIQELTRADLNELLPGVQHFKLRKKISELINKSKQDTAKPIALVLNELKEFLPVDVMENALVPGGVLHGYLPILRDLEKQLAKALDFIQAHVGLLQSYIGEESMEAQSSAASPSVDSATAGNQPSNVAGADTQLQRGITGGAAGETRSLVDCISQTIFKKNRLGRGNETQIEKQPVKVHSRVCGKTLNTHLALMKQVDDLAVGLKQEETSAEDCQVIIAFCPITSRVGTDIDAALNQITSNKDVILVVMHHTFDRCFVASQRSASHYKNVVEEVNVLFHDSMGLLRCETNDKAVTLIHKALQKYSSTTYKHFVATRGYFK
ncbi:uncharacterized protein si:ch211-245h14.1 isoform X2 [Salmo salar]|uniref:Uncharacterized protein si:ch211-245h14.1 isoform X2 n=1 Tax=Salmo salar TaxID=8030 RepID=A0ABM3CYP6_SALSA|nr:uncharacterized protein si:ch211-245h14.1 isoform X2 [Salmo salar]|eukprot:XP_014000009.1 PREDICTED: uncharacterized protein LOC106571435 isoform X2 [Salmo salar]